MFGTVLCGVKTTGTTPAWLLTAWVRPQAVFSLQVCIAHELYTDNFDNLKGLSHEIFGPLYWPVWMHIGLNKNRFWFLNFKEAPSI